MAHGSVLHHTKSICEEEYTVQCGLERLNGPELSHNWRKEMRSTPASLWFGQDGPKTAGNSTHVGGLDRHSVVRCRSEQAETSAILELVRGVGPPETIATCSRSYNLTLRAVQPLRAGGPMKFVNYYAGGSRSRATVYKFASR